MWSNPKFLKLCEELKAKRGAVSFTEGMKLARGFADLGYEEFLLLPSEKLLSLYSGQVTALPQEHAHFFFEVPTADELSERIIRDFWDISALTFEDQRTWKISLVHSKNNSRREFSGASLEEVLVTALSGVAQ